MTADNTDRTNRFRRFVGRNFESTPPPIPVYDIQQEDYTVVERRFVPIGGPERVVVDRIQNWSAEYPRPSLPTRRVYVLAGSANQFQAFYDLFWGVGFSFSYLSQPRELCGLQPWSAPLLRINGWERNNLVANFPDHLTFYFPHWQQSSLVDPSQAMQLPPQVVYQLFTQMFIDDLARQGYLNPASAEYDCSPGEYRRSEPGLPPASWLNGRACPREIRTPDPFVFNQEVAQEWCDANGYTELFRQEGIWWAYGPNYPMPVAIISLVRADWERAQKAKAELEAQE